MFMLAWQRTSKDPLGCDSSDNELTHAPGVDWWVREQSNRRARYMHDVSADAAAVLSGRIRVQ